MSLPRVALIVAQAVSNELACTPPNPTRPNERFYMDEPYIFQIAPLILRAHQLILRICVVFETLFYLASLPQFSALSTHAHYFLLIPQAPLRVTPLFVVGVVAVISGAAMRLTSFHALGELFTFDLTVHPKHRLVTSGPYRFVRHPAYTGTLTMIAGLAFSHLSPGSWLWECLPLHRSPVIAVVLGVVWWLWMLGVGLSRVKAEDAQMRKLFPEEWVAYAKTVPWWFIPHVV
ncbi:hypothetical protein B0H15DRAFT_1010591 [Mycena belliarum]|uniref:Protein-S-isoprenylcysteine O-methyltransferase n=1 Tax=Mycena belliarum TaxID=1033014 RepID=A0AAD6XJI6_9AGAR|nr:hypothetical protein B0H15DRAFT_1010591 [Mycena belliae]